VTKNACESFNSSQKLTFKGSGVTWSNLGKIGQLNKTLKVVVAAAAAAA